MLFRVAVRGLATFGAGCVFISSDCSTAWAQQRYYYQSQPSYRTRPIARSVEIGRPVSIGRPVEIGRAVPIGRPVEIGRPVAVGTPVIVGRPIAVGRPVQVGVPVSVGRAAPVGAPVIVGTPVQVGRPVSTGQSVVVGSPIDVGKPVAIGRPTATVSTTRIGDPTPIGYPTSISQPTNVGIPYVFGVPSTPSSTAFSGASSGAPNTTATTTPKATNVPSSAQPNSVALRDLPVTGIGASGGKALTTVSRNPLGSSAQSISQEWGEPWSKNSNKVHTGVDIPAAKGSAVRATETGTVFSTGWLGCKDGSSNCSKNDPSKSWGYYVVVRQDDGRAQGYLHVGKEIPVGTKIKEGQQVGGIFENHLHYNECKAAGRCKVGAVTPDEFRNGRYLKPNIQIP